MKLKDKVKKIASDVHDSNNKRNKLETKLSETQQSLNNITLWLNVVRWVCTTLGGVIFLTSAGFNILAPHIGIKSAEGIGYGQGLGMFIGGILLVIGIIKCQK